MTLEQQLVTNLVVVLATMTTRFLPFMVFNKKKTCPQIYFVSGSLPTINCYGLTGHLCL